MGYGTRNNGQIKTFNPDDTENRFYLEASSNHSISDIIQKAKEKWGENIDLDDIYISSEHIHTDCLTYDQYDPFDYTDFLIIDRNQT